MRFISQPIAKIKGNITYIMKIAMMVRALLTTPVPRDIGYSPSTIAAQVAEGLQKLGHEITFFGPEGTKLDVTKIETKGLNPRVKDKDDFDQFLHDSDLFKKYIGALDDSVLAKDMLKRAKDGEFDCVMFHHFESAISYAAEFPSVPVVHVLHDYIDSDRKGVILQHATPNQYFVSISNSQRNTAPDINYLKTVYNGIDIEQFDYNPEPGDYLFFSGRITPSKGVAEAIQVAKATKRMLLLAGPLAKADYAYFDEYVRPHLDDQILYLGMLEKEQLVKYYQRASALLVPIQWEEPFGLTMAEANACGTPVIALKRGAVPELIVDSFNGFVATNIAEMILAVKQLHTIKRRNCRDHVKKFFTVEKMCKNYEKALLTLVDKPTKKSVKRIK